MSKADPYRSAEDPAREMARCLIEGATHGALAVLRPGCGLPSVTRIALATDQVGQMISLVSSLSDHTRALQADPACALLIGEPKETGDPLTHPRLTLHAQAEFVDRDTDDHNALRTRYLALRPKSRLYIDFADFSFVRFEVADALLNGGFGKAWRLSPADLAPDQRTT